MFILLLLKQGLVFEKDEDKEKLSGGFGFRFGKVVFALLNKILAVYIGIISIYI